ncbi:MAG: hypothetical protein OXL97_12540 [Chloroflexota bacterium]|nr:hypothetical protein [Chloroflexota bacterium]MDE2883751.1 hypothetical protein [Chloroflexota bacterium]
MDAIDRVSSLADEAKARLTTMLVDQRRQGIPVPQVTRDTLYVASSSASLPVYERAVRLLHHLADSIAIGQTGNMNCADYNLLIASESVQSHEVRAFLGYLEDNGLIRCRHSMGGHFLCEITVDGYGRIEAISTRVDSSQAFVAMWIDDDMKDIYESGIKSAIESAGYSPYRVDKEIVQSPDTGKIDDTIIAEIRRSRLVVADFTHGENGIRGSVYYEAGFAHGLGIPVIYSCRKDQIEKLHFDTRQYYHIAWETPQELRGDLEKRILAMVGEGPNKR